MKRIEIFFWEGYISVAPTLINLANALAEKGHNVVIYTRNTGNFGPPPVLHSNVDLKVIEPNDLVKTVTKTIESLFFWNRILKEFLSIHILLFYLSYMVRKARVKSNGHNNLVIAIDTMGLYWSNMVRNKSETFFYLSLELQGFHYFSQTLVAFFRNREIKIHNKKVALTIIQDKYRLESLKRINHLDDHSQFAILTNSPRSNDTSLSFKENFFEENFSLPKKSFKLLSAGMISEAVLSTDVAKTFSRFSDKTVYMIFHERVKAEKEEEYLLQIKNSGGTNLVLSLNPVPYDMVHVVYTSADAGLVIYNPAYGENFSNIIGASGKLAHYLKYGLPIICLDLSGFKELIDKYKCGVVIQDLNQLEAAVTEVRQNYKSMRDKAYVCYYECYDFDFQLNTIYKNWQQSFLN